MNPVEIEEAVSQLAETPFDPEVFPFAFLEAFGNKATTIKRIKSGSSNPSDVPGGVLQRNNIHLKVCPEGEVNATLTALRESPATTRYKAKFILATDGNSFEAENLTDGETVACDYRNFSDHFGFFLALAGITTVRQIRENAFDIKATGRLNRLYLELQKQNPDWDQAERQEQFNHFMARLIFCFFAEDTNIFHSEGLFTQTIAQMSASDASNTHEVLSEVFRAMNTPLKDRKAAGICSWANVFPDVNGGLFSGNVAVPRFNKIARSYLLDMGNLDWKKINPDIFGSMIQAVADEEERSALGMHYTSVPNILKVLNPLFLDNLRSQLEQAGDNRRKLLNLRQRIARILVFDPACGSGNFLVIAYKEMRKIEAEINRRRGELERRSEIPLTNFRGIEIRHFAAEVARLALIIAKFQCEVLYRGPQLALFEFLPLKNDNWITCGNALRWDWLSLFPPTGRGVKMQREDLDLSGETREQAEIDFENEGGETYICGNPPYLGSKWQSQEQKDDLKQIFESRTKHWKSLDYVSGWFMKAADYGTQTHSAAAFVSTNSICQGQQVPILWPLIFETGHEIAFAHTSFKWANLASHNAGVTVSIIGIASEPPTMRRLFSITDEETLVERSVGYINAYLVPASNCRVEQIRNPLSEVSPMLFGNMPRDGGNFILNGDERGNILKTYSALERFIRPYLGAEEMIQGKRRWCIWIENSDSAIASEHPYLKEVQEKVRQFRLASKAGSTRDFASRPYRFVQIAGTARDHSLVVAKVSSEKRDYIPVDLLNGKAIASDLLFALYDAPLWNMALIASRLHLVWIATVCGKLKTDFRYSNTLGWNTFPVPTLTEQNKIDMTRCAEEILLAREHYFPATIADMYDPECMDREFPRVREAHDRNDEIIERIYIGRRFKNDTERLEKLFELYTKMTRQQTPLTKSTQRKTKS
ncbi:lactate dehydrogenase [Laspinema sp. D1]|uniref:class I SAM-dependent DNA methyltransferase n=1 Tax=Laspinema palackyanum TaxID=3231601 RepID=UPI003481EA8C|nr:lactate dehydrogenase [Laspinema sp. D2b]